jgi:hypothetical protein
MDLKEVWYELNSAGSEQGKVPSSYEGGNEISS